MLHDRHGVSRETFHRLGAEYDYTTLRQPADSAEATDKAGVTGPRLVMPRNGHLVKLRGATTAPEPPNCNKRGIVTGFSYQSRMRLMEYVAGLDRTCNPSHWLFVTLTYPRRYPDDPRTWKKHLHLFAKRLARDFPNIAALWKMEYQCRGAPHFHLLCYGAQYLDYHYVAGCWYDCVDSGDILHYLAGTRVERPRTWNGVACYASKYLGKVNAPQDGQGCGRIWGVINRAKMPHVMQEYALSWAEFDVLRRRMARWARGVKPVPWAVAGHNGRTSYDIRRTKQAQGCKLFADERVGVLLARDLPGLAQKDPPAPCFQAQNGVLGLALVSMPLGGVEGPEAATRGPGECQTGVNNVTIQKGTPGRSTYPRRPTPTPEVRAWAATTFPRNVRRVPECDADGGIPLSGRYGLVQRLLGGAEQLGSAAAVD